MLGIYLSFLIEPTYMQQEVFLKWLMDKASTNPLVLTKTAIGVFEETVKLPREKMLGMFIAWYGEHKAAVNSEVLDTKLKQVSRVMPGQPMVDVTAKDTSEHERLLKDIVAKNKCTMLLFWSSDCSHCREEMPLVKELYAKYHAQGFEIYGVTVESDLNKWRAYIREQQLGWVNTYTYQAASPNPAIDYVLRSTPAMILIDKQGKILHRFTTKNKVEKYIKDALAADK
jgi:peroxiredoxin